MGLVAQRCGILDDIRGVIRNGVPVFVSLLCIFGSEGLTMPCVKATCAGLIMMANEALHAKDGGQPLIGGLDVVVDRNHFGSQLQVRWHTLHSDVN